MRIDPAITAMLLIDVQERLFPHIADNLSIAKRLEVLIQGINALELPILRNQQYTAGLGETIESLRVLLKDDTVYEKRTFSCCDNPDVLEKLKSLSAKTVIVAGAETHVCVLQSVLDLVENGYIPVVVADAMGSRNPKDHEIALRRMESCGAVVTTTESLLFELLRTSKNPHFKTISALVKERN
ncbi:MAG: hydrolase [Sulfurospirillaceae bacterium]|nr:hydrolase [Sulfurospirillaceae bacterium]